MSNRKKIKNKPDPLSGFPTVRKLITELDKTPLKYNGYLCDTCESGFLSIDVDEGTTPMFSPCFATEGCEGQAHSMGYPAGPPPEVLGDPIIMWYKPDPSEYNTLDPELIIYAERGGLIRKATKSAPDWVKEMA